MSGHLLHDDALVHRVAEAAAAATSIHHTQPWRLQMTGPDIVELHFDLDRVLWIADPKGRALRLSCGAALFNVRLALRESGYHALVTPSVDPIGSPTLIASIQLRPGSSPTVGEREMLRALRARRPGRPPFRQVPEAVQVAMEQEAAQEGTTLRVLAAWEVTLVSRMITAAVHELAANSEYCAELAHWPGGPPATSSEWPAPRPAELMSQHLAVLSTAWDRAEDWLRAGQSLQRVLLTAARYRLTTSLLYQPVELQDIRHVDAWWPWPEWPQMIISYS